LYRTEHQEGLPTVSGKQALAEKSGKRAVGYNGQYKVVFDTYWIPLAGEEDLYLHFSINISEYAKESLFPPK
jgi:predicted xylose isomerase-like sugar epimerase